MDVPATTRLYWQDDHCFDANAQIIGVTENSVACDQTCFYPGGGGQPSDDGTIMLPTGQILNVTAVHADPNDVVWHETAAPPPEGILSQTVKLRLNPGRRLAHMRHHTVLHVLNTIALRDYSGW